MGLLTDILFGLAGVAAAGAAAYGAYKLYKFITEDTIKVEAREKFPDALKAKISAKKKAGKTLYVDVYGEDDEQLGTMEMEAENPPQNLYVGQEILL